MDSFSPKVLIKFHIGQEAIESLFSSNQPEAPSQHLNWGRASLALWGHCASVWIQTGREPFTSLRLPCSGPPPPTSSAGSQVQGGGRGESGCRAIRFPDATPAMSPGQGIMCHQVGQDQQCPFMATSNLVTLWPGTAKHGNNFPDVDFPGGSVVKNPSASAGDMGSSPCPGRSHMPRSNWARAPQLLSLRSRAREPQLLSTCATTAEAHAPRACALQQEKPPQWEAHVLQWRVAPTHHN